MQGKAWRAEREGEMILYTEKEINYYSQDVFFSTYGEKKHDFCPLFILFIAFIDLCY